MTETARDPTARGPQGWCVVEHPESVPAGGLIKGWNDEPWLPVCAECMRWFVAHGHTVQWPLLEMGA